MTQTKCCPFFAFWVVVVCLSNGSSRSHRALEGSSLPSSIDPSTLLLVVLREERAQTTMEVPQLFGVPFEIPQVQFLDKLTRALCATTDAGVVAWVRLFLLRRSTLALRLGGSGSWQRSEFYVLLRRYGRRSGQPSSSPLARRACVHVLPYSSAVCHGTQFHAGCGWVFVFFEYMAKITLDFSSAPGPFGGRGEMAMAVASSARLASLCGAVCASTPYTRCCPFVPCTATIH